MLGSRSIYHDGWKATTDHVANAVRRAVAHRRAATTSTTTTGRCSTSPRTSPSRTTSPTSTRTRSAELEELWWAEAGRNQVLPLFEFPGSMAHMHPGEFPPPTSGTYAPGGGPIQESQLPALMGGFELTAYVEVPPGGADGIITATGDRHGGWAAYLLDGRLVATVAMLDRTTRLAAPDPVPAGEHVLSVRYVPGREPRLVLAVDGADVADGPLPGLLFFPNLGSSGAGMLVGRDRGIAVSKDYSPPFAFTGTLSRVELRSGRPGARPEASAELRVALAGD